MILSDLHSLSVRLRSLSANFRGLRMYLRSSSLNLHGLSLDLRGLGSNLCCSDLCSDVAKRLTCMLACAKMIQLQSLNVEALYCTVDLVFELNNVAFVLICAEEASQGVAPGLAEDFFTDRIEMADTTVWSAQIVLCYNEETHLVKFMMSSSNPTGYSEGANPDSFKGLSNSSVKVTMSWLRRSNTSALPLVAWYSALNGDQ